MIIDQQMNQFTLPSTASGFDVWYLPQGAASQIGILNVNLAYPTALPATTTQGAAFDMQNCTGCYIEHFRFSGQAYDLFDLGYNAVVPSPAPTHVVTGNWTRSLINDAISDAGAGFHGAAFRFNGPVGNAIFSNFVLSSAAVPEPTGTPPIPSDGIGVIADDSAFVQPTAFPTAGATPIPNGTLYPNWDAIYFEQGDFEQTAVGFYINMPQGLINDIFIDGQIVDTTQRGPAVSINVSGATAGPSFTPSPPGVARRIHLTDMWIIAGAPTPAPMVTASPASGLYLSASGAGQLYDVQVTGGHATSRNADAIFISPNVTGVELTGVQEYQTTLGCGVNDSGIDTVITGGVDAGGLGASPAAVPTAALWGPNKYGICGSLSSRGGHYVGVDLRGDTSNAIITVAGAGSSAAPIFAADNNVAGYSGSTAFSFNSGSFISAVNNPGYGGFAGENCLANVVTQAGPLTCMDDAGNILATSYTLGSNTQLGYGGSSHCGVVDDAFIFFNGASYYLVGDTSGNVGVCGDLEVAGTRTKGTATCTEAIGATSCTATVTVLSGAKCTVSYDNTSTLVPSPQPLAVSVSGTSLVITGVSAATTTTPFHFDYICL